MRNVDQIDVKVTRILLTVQTEVTLKKKRRLVSDPESRVNVAQIRIEKLRFHVICSVHTVMEGEKT